MWQIFKIITMKFDYIQNRFTFYSIAAVLFILSLIAPFAFSVNYGIDMTGGTQAEYDYAGNFDKSATEAQVVTAQKAIDPESKTINSVTVYGISGEKRFVVEAGFSKGNLSDAELEAKKTQFKDAISAAFEKDGVKLSRYVNVGESFGQYIKTTAYATLAIVIVAISLYIAYAFRGSIEGFTSFSFGFVTAISLFHDVIIAFGLFVFTSVFFPEFKIDTFFITAMLTILGYSINDTIVVMDRIRSNLKLPSAKKMNTGTIVNNSINETLTRSIFTSMTVVIVLVALFFFGPQAIQGFSLALIFGTLIGTYSSIFIAAPLLYDITKKKSV
jgi:preprotein translocase SecF subunit